MSIVYQINRLVYNIFNQIRKNNLTGYKYDDIILVTSQVTPRLFGGEKSGKCQFTQVLHGKGGIYAKNVSSGAWYFGTDLNSQAQKARFWHR